MSVPPDTRLAPHFTARELDVDQPAANDAIVENAKRLAAWLETARGILGVPLRVTSGFRTPAQNAAVGGVADSAHLTGEAADFVPLGQLQFDSYLRLKNSAEGGRLPDWDQLVYYPGSGHIHVSVDRRSRREVRIKGLEGEGFPALTDALASRLRGFG